MRIKGKGGRVKEKEGGLREKGGRVKGEKGGGEGRVKGKGDKS